MVSINSESTGLSRQGSDGDEKFSQSQSDCCITRNQRTIVGIVQENSHCSSTEYDIVIELPKHSPLTTKYSTPSEYSGLVHFKSDLSGIEFYRIYSSYTCIQYIMHVYFNYYFFQ